MSGNKGGSLDCNERNGDFYSAKQNSESVTKEEQAVLHDVRRRNVVLSKALELCSGRSSGRSSKGCVLVLVVVLLLLFFAASIAKTELGRRNKDGLSMGVPPGGTSESNYSFKEEKEAIKRLFEVSEQPEIDWNITGIMLKRGIKVTSLVVNTGVDCVRGDYSIGMHTNRLVDPVKADQLLPGNCKLGEPNYYIEGPCDDMSSESMCARDGGSDNGVTSCNALEEAQDILGRVGFNTASLEGVLEKYCEDSGERRLGVGSCGDGYLAGCYSITSLTAELTVTMTGTIVRANTQDESLHFHAHGPFAEVEALGEIGNPEMAACHGGDETPPWPSCHQCTTWWKSRWGRYYFAKSRVWAQEVYKPGEYGVKLEFCSVNSMAPPGVYVRLKGKFRGDLTVNHGSNFKIRDPSNTTYSVNIGPGWTRYTGDSSHGDQSGYMNLEIDVVGYDNTETKYSPCSEDNQLCDWLTNEWGPKCMCGVV